MGEVPTEGPDASAGALLSWSYRVEQWMYGTGIAFGIIAVIFTLRRLMTSNSTQWDLAARLVKYKISLTVADLIILFIYAPTQLLWIYNFWWFGGDFYCRFYKFLSTFGFHLTGNMQALIAIDRLNVMSKINKLTKESYSSTVAVAVAWALAFVCSIPQFFVFYAYQVKPHNNLQCVAHWTVVFQEHAEHKEVYEWHTRMTEAIESGNATGPLDPLDFNMEEVNSRLEFYQNLEEIYNVVHLMTIVLLPYLIELVSYLIIILLLNAASTGQFMGFRAVIKSVILKLPCITIFFRVKESLRRHHSNSRERRRLQEEKGGSFREQSSLRIKSIQPKVSLVKRSSKSQSSSPTDQPLHFDFPADVRVAGYTNGHVIRSPDYHPSSRAASQAEISTDNDVEAGINEKQRKSDSILQYKERSKGFWKMRQKTIDPLFKTELSDDQRRVIEDRPIETAHPATPVREVAARRLSDPVTPCEKKITRIPTAPWMKTVVKAKRNTKKKVFVMITINLICWLPYFAHAVFSSIQINTEFISSVQFYTGLVVFNAISNILL